MFRICFLSSYKKDSSQTYRRHEFLGKNSREISQEKSNPWPFFWAVETARALQFILPISTKWHEKAKNAMILA